MFRFLDHTISNSFVCCFFLFFELETREDLVVTWMMHMIRVLPYLGYKGTNMNPERCIQLCKEESEEYIYSGVQVSNTIYRKAYVFITYSA